MLWDVLVLKSNSNSSKKYEREKVFCKIEILLFSSPVLEMLDEDSGSHYVKNPQRGEKMRQRSGAVGMLSRIKSRSRENPDGPSGGVDGKPQ